MDSNILYVVHLCMNQNILTHKKMKSLNKMIKYIKNLIYLDLKEQMRVTFQDITQFKNQQRLRILLNLLINEHKNLCKRKAYRKVSNEVKR